MREVPLLDLPHHEARRVLASGAPVYLTMNPVEYHGPHLSLHNDRLLSIALVRALHARLALGLGDPPLLLAGDLEIGVDPCSGPGSRRARYPVARRLVREACRALVELGATRVVLMTFHGSPFHNLALEQGVALLRAAGVRALAPFHAVLDALLVLDDPSPFSPAVAGIADAATREALLAGLGSDFHAGFFETSLALHFAPETVSPVRFDLPPCPAIRPAPGLARLARLARLLGRDRLARELDFVALGTGWYALRPFPGYTGSPAHASAEAGAFFAERILDVCEPLVRDVLAGVAEGPRPILEWLGPATLGGRLVPRPVPTRHVTPAPP